MIAGRAAGRLLVPARIASFRWFWIASALSVAGDFFSYIAVSWLTLQLSGSALALGTVLMAQGIPRAGLMLVGGALSDRMSARRIMIVSSLARTVLMAAMAVLAATGRAQLWHVYVYAVLFGIVGAFFLPAAGTMLPRLVPDDLLEAGNSLINIGGQTARVIGPAAAGLVVAHFGPAPSFALDGVCFLLCAVAVAALSSAAAAPTAGAQGLLSSIGAGLAYSWSDPAMRALIAIVVALNFAVTGPFNVGLVVISRQRFSGAAALGLMLAANATGSLIGTVTGGTLRLRRLGVVFILVPLATGALTAAIGFTSVLVLAMAFMSLFGIGTGLINVMSPTWIQRRSEPAMLGRVMGLVNVAALGSAPLSMAVAGLLAQVSVTLLLVLSAALQVGSAGVASLSRTFRRL
jgi:hypothetical protein